MPTNIDDILNPKPKPDTAEELVMAVLRVARESNQALTKEEVIRGCRVNWFDVAKPGEGGLILALFMNYAAHETGLRSTLDTEREAALFRLIEKGLVRTKEHEGEMLFWADEQKSLRG